MLKNRPTPADAPNARRRSTCRLMQRRAFLIGLTAPLLAAGCAVPGGPWPSRSADRPGVGTSGGIATGSRAEAKRAAASRRDDAGPQTVKQFMEAEPVLLPLDL